MKAGTFSGLREESEIVFTFQLLTGPTYFPIDISIRITASFAPPVSYLFNILLIFLTTMIADHVMVH